MDERQTIYIKTNTNNKRSVIYTKISSTPRGGELNIMLGCTKHSCEDTSGKLTLRSVKNRSALSVLCLKRFVDVGCRSLS